jgi:hypothetical protein
MSSWGDSAFPETLSGLPLAEGTFSLNGNVYVDSLAEFIGKFANRAVDLSVENAAAVAAMQSGLTAALATFSSTYAVTLAASPYAAQSFSGVVAPTVPPVPTLATLAAAGTAPVAPNPATSLLSDAAYLDAFALLRNAALETEAHDLLAMSMEAAAWGEGLPYAAQQAAIVQIQQVRSLEVSKAGLALSQKKADDLRADKKWAYEQQLAFWKETEAFLLARWETVAKTDLALWSQKFQGSTVQFTSDLALITAKLADAKLGLDSWSATNKGNLEKAKDSADAALRLQTEMVRTTAEYVFAVAGAKAQEFQAWLSAAHIGLGGSGSVDSAATYIGP